MDLDRLQRLVGNNKTIRQISEELGTSYTNVRHWLKKYGLRTHRTGLAIERKSLSRQTFATLQCKHHGLSKFAKRLDKRDGVVRWKCKRCEYASLKKRRLKIKRELVALFGGACQRCGYKKCLRALSFHHRDARDKEFQVSSSLRHSWDHRLAEAKKCVLLCANCHMEIEDEIAGL